MTEQSSYVSSVCAECGAPVRFELGAAHAECDQCGAGMAVSGHGVVRLACPCCKGNLYFIDGALSGRCPYCDAALLALTREQVHRYVIRPAAPSPVQGAAIHFFPFWRLSARLHGWNVGAASRDWSRSSWSSGAVGGERQSPSEVEKVPFAKIVEKVVPDSKAFAFGLSSLGLRSEVLPMEPLTREHEALGRVVPVGNSAAEAREALFAAAVGEPVVEEMDLECQRADVVAETVSLLYYPYWVIGDGTGQSAWDGVTGDTVSLLPSGDASEEKGAEIFDDLTVTELSCKSCGEALEPGLSVAVFPCPGCGTFWAAGKKGLDSFPGWSAEPLVGAPSLWLPFWRVATELKLRGRAARVAGELRNVITPVHRKTTVPPAPPETPLCYFVPAYGSRRAVGIDGVARDMTRHQPLLRAGPPASGKLASCLYSPEDARRLAYVIWLGLVTHSTPRLLRSLRIETSEVSLWYVPFEQQGRELVNLVTGIRYDRSAITGVTS